ncbi:MAG: accessory factor UbiK family protein [Magnetococcales bacterium]|nr:accessory factor UbiK family protein [Magnetococcales bacterium]NGZ25473.1 accessory factor UbiK family protein [Magnetococcales bacterium]
MQIDNAVLDQITQRILGIFEAVGDTHQEMVRKVRGVVQEGVEHFDLVDRVEFEAVRQLLANTRIKADALEKRVNELEAALAEISDK